MLDQQSETMADHNAWVSELVASGRLTPALQDEILSNITGGTAKDGHGKAVYVDRDQAFALPFLIRPEDWTQWAQCSRHLISLVWRVVTSRIESEDRTFLAASGVSNDLANLLDLTPKPSSPNDLIARPDFFLGEHGPIFLETNIDSSLGGLGTADPLARIYHSHGIREGQPLFATPTLARHLSRGLPESPSIRVAIVDWADEIDDVPWPYDRMAEDLDALGLTCETAKPDDLAYQNGRLTSQERPVDVVYRGLTPVGRLWENPQSFAPLWRAATEGLPIVSSLWSVAYSSKTILAWLWEMALEGDLPDEDTRFVRRHIPWTVRVAAEYCKTPEGERLTLAGLMSDWQADLVIKSPSDGSCKNVTIGRYVTPEVWQQAFADARENPGYIVQAYTPPNEVLNAGGGGEPLIIPYRCNFSVFVFGKDVAGTCIRGTATETSGYISCMHGAREGIAMVRNRP